MEWRKLTEFEIYVMDLVESYKPQTAQDYEDIADTLHQRLENAICDMIIDDDKVDIDDYSPSY